MDFKAFAWSVLASLAAAMLWVWAQNLARWLVRLRARRLGPGPEAERLLEEWLSDLLQLESRLEQLRFALGLFIDSGGIEAEIENRSAERQDLDALLEDRYLELVAAQELSILQRLDEQREALEQSKYAELEAARASLMHRQEEESKVQLEAEIRMRTSRLEDRIKELERQLHAEQDWSLERQLQAARAELQAARERNKLLQNIIRMCGL